MTSGSQREERARVLSELEPASSAHEHNLSRVRYLALEEGDHGLRSLMTEYRRSASKVEVEALGLECVGALRVWEGQLVSATMLGLSRFADVFTRRVLSFFD